MPVEFLSDEQAAAYGRFLGEPAREQLERFFWLDDADLARIGRHRRNATTLGYAVQLGTVPSVVALGSRRWEGAPLSRLRPEAHYLNGHNGFPQSGRRPRLIARPLRESHKALLHHIKSQNLCLHQPYLRPRTCHPASCNLTGWLLRLPEKELICTEGADYNFSARQFLG